MVRYSTTNRGFPAGNPVANVLVVLVGALVIGASVVLGFLAFMILASIILVMAAIIGVRVWWFNRKMKKSAVGGQKPQESGGVIEGEYHVIVEDPEEHR